MNNRIFIFLTIFSMNLVAFNIDDAINTALKNNYNLKQQKYILDESRLNRNLEYSAFKPKIDLNYVYTNKDEIITGQIKEDSTVNVTISYNLFNGFKDKYNIDASNDLYNSSKFTLEASRQDLILKVKTKYIDYLLQEKNKQTFHEALNLYTKQYKDQKNFFDQGLIAKNELLEVEVQMLQAKQDLQNAKTSLKLAKKELENILGENINDDIKPINLNENINFQKNNVENRSELKVLELIVSSYQNRSKASMGEFLPKVNIAYSVNKYGEDINPANRAGYPDKQNVGTINASWNLYNGNNDKSKILIQKKKSSQTKMQLEDLKLRINLQYENAKEQLDLSKFNLETSTKALELSNLNYKIVSNKLKEGVSSNKDLIDANYLLTKSKQNYFSAYYGRYLSIATLQRILEIE